MIGDLEKRPLALVALLSHAAEAALKQRADALQLDMPTYVARLVEHLAASMVRSHGPTGPERVVLDASAYYNALLDPKGYAANCVARVEAREVEVFTSRGIFAELREMPRTLPDEEKVAPEHIEELIERVSRHAEFFEDVPTLYQHPEDDFAGFASETISLAVHDEHRVPTTIITNDLSLLDLMEVESDEGWDFQCRFPHIRIVDPDTFVQERADRRPTTNRSPANEIEGDHVREVAVRMEESDRHQRMMERSKTQGKEQGL